ncbi:DUF3413 domain-containing protein [Paraneptunicella aestuarii]|uniref:DUF3413 domain-containing protein n=1 Tax=Paraneptunicella aestuarii TaxID=2831148 RepID=UPI001E388EDF|nr:DUF3413 domain-containing protein [Paraneptunicella aestuarii]UAA40275.1 DUF3413 domain-containing protein [Paraneptunicella aestuarii]
MIISETPRRQLVSKLVGWGHWFTLVNIVVAIAISGVYLFSSRVPSTLLGILYLFTNWFSHIGFLTFFGFVIFILPICYLIPNSRFIRAYGSITAAIALAMLALDALLYTRYGLHLSFSSAEFIRDHAKFAIAEVSSRQWAFFGLSFIAWLFLQLLIANALWKRVERLQKLKFGLPISAAFTAMFVFSHATHIWADAELYQPIVQQDDMFPLSYPATAKTLMSKYGMLNRENYNQRKQLQLSIDKGAVTYPTEPLYCVIDTQAKATLLMVMDADSLQSLEPSMVDSLNLNKLTNHYDLSLSSRSAVKSTLYGLPDLYHWKLGSHRPILLDLPDKLGLPVHLYSHDPSLFATSKVNGQDNWEIFSNSLSEATPGLFIGFITQAELNELLKNTDTSQLQKLFISHFSANHMVDAYTNLPISPNRLLSLHEDIPATLLGNIGCNAKTELHSTGQNLTKANRTWLVTTQDDKVLIMHQDLKIQVDSRGNFVIYNQDGSQNTSTELNTGLLSQAIKLLSKFADNE